MKRVLYFLIFFAIIIIGCSDNDLSSYEKMSTGQVVRNDTVIIMIEDIKKKFLGNKIFHECILDGFVFRDSAVEGDEGLSWPARFFYRNDILSFYLESNWVDTSIVNRIVILDTAICSRAGICVGQRIENRSLFEPNLPIEPDGYLSVNARSDKAIHCFFDISDYPELHEGIGNISLVPSALKIDYIVIQE